ncbi:MAG TPA: histidine kinase dimerization/phospho-acceptor domain-containing protein, partial [Vicinamibacterales bacterium]|nr:histidine kinase dimerization/phospho-acceptor domain-containing protein [Vicinamibacterales bacterium]
MPPTSSLSNRIFIACALVATLSLGFAFYFVNARATREAEAELRRGLNEAGILVNQNRVDVTDTFTRLARLVADLPKLKAAVETGDRPTVQPLADEYRDQVRADVLLLTGKRGELLGQSGAGADELTVPAALKDVESTDEISTFAPHSRGVLQVVSVPIFLEGEPPDVLGRLTVGFFLDDRFANQIKRLTNSEIAFGSGDRILASTLPPDSRTTLAPVLGMRDIATVRIDDEEFLALARPLVPSNGAPRNVEAATQPSPVVITLRSRTERLRFLDTIRTGLEGALIVTLILATIASYAVARTVTRPVSAITHAMRDVAATGDLTRKVSLHSGPWDDEDARLLASTFNTLTESIARFQAEAAQRERLSSLGRLSTVIAHEIRNPLMIIKATLSTLRRQDLTLDERREAVADIAEETTRLNRIVTEVLDFAKPITFEFAESSINDICLASAAAAWAGEVDGQVALELDSSLPRITTDPERLRAALVNILTNARHAVTAAHLADRHGGVVVRTRGNGNGHVVISIRDRGIGIAAEDMPHIF